MLYDVSHRTVYKYSQPVSISHHLLHMSPRTSDRQANYAHRLHVEPAPAISETLTDYFGNPANYLTIQQDHTKLVLHVTSRIEVMPPELPEPASTPAWDSVPATLAADFSPDGLDIFQYTFDSNHTVGGEGISEYARPSFPTGRPILEAALDLNRRIFKDFSYSGSATDVSTPIDDVLEMRQGVCQDFAHLQLACFRSLGLAARYVSGYIRTYSDKSDEKLIGADASHAWVSLFVPGTGWVDLDPTNNKPATEEHITIAWGRDYADVSPINGFILGGGAHEVSVAVEVKPLGQPVARHVNAVNN
ncbi:MAG: transglutaminase family protein [Magnetovibrionaceae bacterium]